MSRSLITAISHRWETELAERVGQAELVHVARRCADLADLLAAAAAGLGDVAAVSVDLRGLDRSVVAQLHEHGLRVLGVHAPGDESGAHLLRRLGVGVVVPADADEHTLHEALTRLLNAPVGTVPGTDTAGDGRAPELTDDADDERRTAHEGPDDEASDGPPGQVIVVWGPTGAPGRTTVAINLAGELAQTGAPTVLVDADTYGASVAQVLAVLDEAPGLAAAARAADQGRLDRAVLGDLAPEVRPGLRVLTGLPRADRWTELRDHAVADVLLACTRLARWTVVDAGFCVEEDEELSFDTAAPRRNGATLTALTAADQLVVVGSGDPVGLQRLVRAVDDVAERTVARRTVVVTRVRAGAVGPDPGRRVRDALERFAGLEAIHLVPEDRDAMDEARLAGELLLEVRPRSAAREAIAALVPVVTESPTAAAAAPAGRGRRRHGLRALRR